jgi:PadR family transcriptional regulator, regulatory protein PadR
MVEAVVQRPRGAFLRRTMRSLALDSRFVNGACYGYAIILRVAELSGGHFQWTDGMLYPGLHRLERQGLVAAKWAAAESGRRRKYYRITKEGRPQLAAQRQQWQAVDHTRRGIWMKACPV